MQKFDIVIVGGGMVGLTLALAIRKSTSLTVAIIEPSPMSELTDEPEVRVSAINAASQQVFENLQVWSLIQAQRSQPYQQMHIWDKAGYGQLDFSLKDVNHTPEIAQLGWIIENKVIRNALWTKAEQNDGITFFTDCIISNLSIGDNEVFISFNSSVNNQMPITAKLVVGADGAHSWVKKQMDIATTFRDYDHHAIVATVKCSQGHSNTAWQVFLSTGPLALLPLYQDDLCSIVWSTTPNDAKRLLALSPEEFAKELTAASDGKLGKITLVSERFCHPLTMRFAQDFIKERIVLVGDAAHTIHPLAGQGVNLGILDAAALAQILAEQVSKDQNYNTSKLFISNKAITSNSWLNSTALAPALNQYNRWRKSDASEMIVAMESIKQLFTPQQGIPKLLRGLGMTLLNNIKPAKTAMINQALGYKGELPEIAAKPLR
ncbi:MAG: FAD-dependent monooxygenase [Colwellia sp.]|nr:FAD-dependent monooxygenase [Colwellia sp.]